MDKRSILASHCDDRVLPSGIPSRECGLAYDGKIHDHRMLCAMILVGVALCSINGSFDASFLSCRQQL